MNASMFFLNGVVAKVTTGVTLVVVAVGGMQAVEKYELTDKLQEVSVVEQEIDLEAPLEEQFPGDREIVVLADIEPEIEVSEFAKNTDLEGCEKGQAVAAQASKNKSEDDEKNACDKKKAEEDDEDGVNKPVVEGDQGKGQGKGAAQGADKGAGKGKGK